MNSSRSIEDRVRELSPAQRVWLAQHLNHLNAAQSSDDDRSDLVAWVVAKADGFDERQIRSQMLEKLPSRLVPRRIIPIDSIPRTASGKVDRKRLAARPIPHAFDQDRELNLISESERILIQICRHLLHVGKVSPQDHFFHIGGDSLSSLRLISMAREQGLEIEPADVLRASSIAELAAAADSRRDGLTAAPSLATEVDVVTKIRSGAGAGSLLLVHEVGGQCHYAHYLAAELSSRWPIYISRQPAIEQSPRSIESLARLYCDAWLEKQPDGPRVLVAFCWGGLLAYEITRQMKQRGASIDHLLIVESGTEASYANAPMTNRIIDRSKGFFVRIRNRLPAIRDRKGMVQLIRSLIGKLSPVSRTPITADAGFQFRDDEGDPGQIRLNVQAFLDYAVAKEAVAMHLFRVGAPAGLIGTRYCDHTLGWRYVVGDRLTVHHIGGTHSTCMQPPHVSALATQMNEVIEGR